MGKLINTDKLDRLVKALDNRINVSAEELRTLIEEVRDMFGGRSLMYLTQAEYDALDEEAKNDETISYFITDAEDLSHEHENKEFLDSLSQTTFDNINSEISDIESMFGGKSLVYVTQAEFDALSEEEKTNESIMYIITDAKASKSDKVVQVNVVNGKLTLTDDKYQKTTMVDGTEIVFPTVTEFTEIHLYFSSESNMNLTFPDCKWRVEPNIEAGSSYEIIATYNTIEWLVNCIVYS